MLKQTVSFFASFIVNLVMMVFIRSKTLLFVEAFRFDLFIVYLQIDNLLVVSHNLKQLMSYIIHTLSRNPLKLILNYTQLYVAFGNAFSGLNLFQLRTWMSLDSNWIPYSKHFYVFWSFESLQSGFFLFQHSIRDTF